MISTTTACCRLLANILYIMSYVKDWWHSKVSLKTLWRNPGEDRGVQLWLGLGNRGALTNDVRDWTHSALVYIHVLRVSRRVGRIGVL